MLALYIWHFQPPPSKHSETECKIVLTKFILICIHAQTYKTHTHTHAHRGTYMTSKNWVLMLDGMELEVFLVSEWKNAGMTVCLSAWNLFWFVGRYFQQTRRGFMQINKLLWFKVHFQWHGVWSLCWHWLLQWCKLNIDLLNIFI